MKKIAVIGVVLVAMAGILVWLLPETRVKGGEAESFPLLDRVAQPPPHENAEAVPSTLQDETSPSSSESGEDSASPFAEQPAEDAEPQSEDEKREVEEEKRVNDFDNLTDKWMEPSPKGVTMDDIDNFSKSFRKIPKARQDECIHRALNLIPDENVMLLAGVLLDKTMDKEIVETVYNDILNRDENVKKPILQQIFKDKSHPCWADTAWILDVTGELPVKK